MKKLIGLLCLVFISLCAQAQAQVIRGEVSAGNYANIKVDSSGIVSTALPTDAATATLQTTANTTLSTISTNTPTLVGGREPILPVSITATTTWLTSAVRAASVTQADQTNTTGAKGIILYCNVTAVPTIESLQFSLQGKDSLSSTYFTVGAMTATVATGFVIIKVSPQLLAVAASVTGITAADYLPYTWRLVATHSASGNWTYSCSYSLVY